MKICKRCGGIGKHTVGCCALQVYLESIGQTGGNEPMPGGQSLAAKLHRSDIEMVNQHK